MKCLMREGLCLDKVLEMIRNICMDSTLMDVRL